MLRDLYAPSNLTSRNKAPHVSRAKKLKIIASNAITAYDSMYKDCFSLKLPFVWGASLTNPKDSRDETDLYMVATAIDVGDEALYGEGIGTRLMKASVRYALEKPDKPLRFVTGHARLGLVNTAVKVFGEDNVAIEYFGNRYGWKSERPLEAVFDDYPLVKGLPYIVSGIDARINREQAMTWELPVPASTSE